MPSLIRIDSPEWDQTLRAQGYRCYYCGRAYPRLAREHKTPRFRGGSDDPSNIVGACADCNSSKGKRTEEEFRAYVAQRKQEEADRLAAEQHARESARRIDALYASGALEEKVISQAEAARMMGLSRARVTQLIDAGVLPYVERTVTERAVREKDVQRLIDNPRRAGRPRRPEGAADA